MSNITTAMVLAAGLGTRMRPLTENKPKPLVVFKGRPLIDHVLARLQVAEISRAVVNVHYLGGMLIDHLAATATPEIVISDERDALLDTAGGIIKALPLIGVAPFLIHNSDSVWYERQTESHSGASNIGALIEAWDPHTMDALLMLADGPSSIGYTGHGDFHAGPDIGPLVRCKPGETSRDVYCGVAIMKPESFASRDPSSPLSLNTIWDELISARRLYGMRMSGLWMHIGDPDALAKAEHTPSPFEERSA